ncbi:hypothetical protein RhiirA1_466844 [Rhizophagus irregularis]|uniref:Uncharacterized protein n=1 Tax=Rhizophagus irregularis TaxID=588596 RepID=A0A2N0RD71_9GLOM|nr:hypothetical protein RhiirA1_466844 [Rhizophagus irregularis]
MASIRNNQRHRKKRSAAKHMKDINRLLNYNKRKQTNLFHKEILNNLDKTCINNAVIEEITYHNDDKMDGYEEKDKKKSQSKKFKRIGKHLIIKNKDGINMEESPILIKCHGCERNIKRNKDNNECLIYLENDSKDIKDARFNERIELLDSLIDAEIEFIEILKNSIYCEKEEDQHNENGVKDVISSKTQPTNFEVNETRDENQLSHDHNNANRVISPVQCPYSLLDIGLEKTQYQYFEMDDYEETGYYLLQLIIEKCYLGQLTLEQSYVDKIILKEKVIQKSEWCLCCNMYDCHCRPIIRSNYCFNCGYYKCTKKKFSKQRSGLFTVEV